MEVWPCSWDEWNDFPGNLHWRGSTLDMPIRPYHDSGMHLACADLEITDSCTRAASADIVGDSERSCTEQAMQTGGSYLGMKDGKLAQSRAPFATALLERAKKGSL